jgi:hypothetical protein
MLLNQEKTTFSIGRNELVTFVKHSVEAGHRSSPKKGQECQWRTARDRPPAPQSPHRRPTAPRTLRARTTKPEQA